MDLAADFEQPERCQMAAVVQNVLPNPREQAYPHQRLIRCDRISDPYMSLGVKMERARHLLADEGVVVDFIEALRGGHVADATLVLAHRIVRRYNRFDQRRLRRDGIISDHAA